MNRLARLAPLALLLTSACSDVEAPDGCYYEDDELICPQDSNHGLVTKLILSFTPDGGGDTLSFAWSDPENDGDPKVDRIVLPDGSEDDQHRSQEYTLDLEVWNELVEPAQDVTIEILDLDHEHQFFLTGPAVDGPATAENPEALIAHDYADVDENDLPVGLTNTITTLDLGQSELMVTLRHMPWENGEPVKTESTTEDVVEGGFAAIGGSNDIQVTFEFEVE